MCGFRGKQILSNTFKKSALNSDVDPQGFPRALRREDSLLLRNTSGSSGSPPLRRERASEFILMAAWMDAETREMALPMTSKEKKITRMLYLTAVVLEFTSL